MDRPLAELIRQLAVQFLSPSQSFEPYLPNSNQNISHSLALLSDLGKITQDSFPPLPPPILPPHVVTHLDQVLSPGHNHGQGSLAVPSDMPPPPLSRNQEYQRALKDQRVIEALLKLKSKQSSVKDGGRILNGTTLRFKPSTGNSR